MVFRESHGLLLGQFEELSGRGVTHAVSTRAGGLSAPPFQSLNLGLHVPDESGHVLENRRRFCEAVGVEPGALVVPQQVHGRRVVRVGRADRGRGALEHAAAIPQTDGLICKEPGVALIAFSSDCPLILLHDPRRRAIGLLHSGWRGTVARIAERGIEAFRECFQSGPTDLTACICPSIGPCCFEVRDDVLGAAVGAGLPIEQVVQSRDGRAYLNLWRANSWLLEQAGVKPERIICPGICTACRTDLFFSHRREDGRTGRFAALIMLQP